jgi:hypothetical protein
MSRFHVNTPATLAAVRLAIDQGLGYRDAAGDPVVVQMPVIRDGLQIGTIASDVFCATYGVPPSTAVAPEAIIVAGDGATAAIEIPESPLIDALLGTTIHGHTLPTLASLIQVPRPRFADLLPSPIRDYLDDRWLDEVFFAQPSNSSAGISEVIAELTPLARARRAIRRMRIRRGEPPM